MNDYLQFWDAGWYQNPYFLALYGLVAYTLIEWSIAKDRYDDKHRKFNFKRYVRERYDNWVVTLILTPIIAWFGPELLNGTGRYLDMTVTWSDAMYLCVGALAYVVNHLVKRAHRFIKGEG